MRMNRTMAAAALALALAVPGCDWLKGSGSGSRVTPFVSSLDLSRPAVGCAQSFGIAFDYDDPQEDISLLRVGLQHSAGTRRERQVLWDDSGELDLRTPGRAVYTFAFSCSDPGGRWTVEVEVEDLRGHVSNTIRADISLASAQ